MSERAEQVVAHLVTPVPTLDELAREPDKAAALPTETARALFGQAVLVQAVLLPQMLRSDAATVPPDPADGWISLDEAAAICGRPRAWLLRRHPRPAWLKRLGRKTFVVSARGLRRWLDSRPS